MPRPPKKDWSRWISLGLYVGSAGNPEMNWEKVAHDLYDSHFNAISLHLMSPWDNEGNYPWVFDPVAKKFNMTKPNPVYYEELEKMCERLAYYYIGVEIAFFDDYFESQWVDDQPWPYHPFRDNKFNVKWGDKFYGKWFYDGVIFDPKAKFLWLSWKDVDNYHFTDYKTIAPMGQPLVNYVKKVIAVIKKIKAKYPGFRVRYKTFNETRAVGDVVNGEFKDDRARSKGDRAEIQSYIRDLMKENLQGTRGYIDYVALVDGDVYVPTTAEASKWIKKFGFEEEVHFAYDEKHVKALLAAGLPRTSLLSSDGKKELPEVHYGQGDSPYFDDLAEVEAMNLPNVDYKLWARYKGPRKWRVGQMMWNWNEFFPLMEQIF